MINPWLQERLFEFPLRPLVVEVEPEALESVVVSLLGRGLGVRKVVRRFSMLGLLPVPARLIPLVDALPGVRAVHADLEINALQLPAVADRTLWYPTSESRQALEAELAFREGWTGEATVLGVVDTGIDPTSSW
ncbi:MAG: hypothetical protein JRI59_03895 [Deltaproteobacteria bacterium]|nr:hypothetical protein [Deltaproteobacteria bacterium]